MSEKEFSCMCASLTKYLTAGVTKEKEKNRYVSQTNEGWRRFVRFLFPKITNKQRWCCG